MHVYIYILISTIPLDNFIYWPFWNVTLYLYYIVWKYTQWVTYYVTLLIQKEQIVCASYTCYRHSKRRMSTFNSSLKENKFTQIKSNSCFFNIYFTQLDIFISCIHLQCYVSFLNIYSSSFLLYHNMLSLIFKLVHSLIYLILLHSFTYCIHLRVQSYITVYCHTR